MTRDGLTLRPTFGHVAMCVVCHENTKAPVPVRDIPSTSGPETTLYACPDHAAEVSPGPILGELDTRP
ncbi:hypothetical protein SAMN04487983_100765 [Streptomyces sp. yr375]|uniref:hypothetical protein n=1 Tax=Streptomyces sp. yr375 TaxID=1761906 RepID=UPI0008B3AF97|nr:hypothetical protein [Streptomyces sp. yr375]SEQ67956.1 hypothetical protein SAMN04487983_100765 [Streptomyces sp. yr375]